MPLFSVGQTNLYYEARGRGEPLVMIPGMGIDSRTCFSHQVAGLAQPVQNSRILASRIPYAELSVPGT